ncbi:MAG: hypothetical protein F4X81_08405, partial [Gammaproteobacteria bacterium]|nr:hypothetical protein [Gammaproteobacteria bacterium]
MNPSKAPATGPRGREGKSMADVTVEELAATVKTPVERLLKQMADAGLPHTNGQESVSEQQKHDLLAHLRSSHGAGATLKPRGTISLKRRSVGTVKAVSQGRTGHKVKVEVMRRRTYVKPEEVAAEPAAPGVREPTAAELEAQRIRDQEQQRKEAEEEARRAAERKAEEAERLRKEEEQRAQEEQAAKALKQAEPPGRPTSRVGAEALSPEVAAAEAQAKAQATEKAGKRVKGKDRDRANRDGFGQGRAGRRELSLKSERRGRRKIRRAHAPIKVEQQGGEFKPTEFIAREVEVPDMITVGELAQRMTVKAGEVIKTL